MTDSLLVDRRILVVEDEMLVLMLIEGMLEDLGCRAISSASTVQEALDLVAKNTFDAATLDVNLTGSTSLPVAEVLADLGVPFAFATGYPDPRVLNGFSDRPLLKKPFREEDLASVLEELLVPRQALSAGNGAGNHGRLT